jgi:hypothetical protein
MTMSESFMEIEGLLHAESTYWFNKSRETKIATEINKLLGDLHLLGIFANEKNYKAFALVMNDKNIGATRIEKCFRNQGHQHVCVFSYYVSASNTMLLV